MSGRVVVVGSVNRDVVAEVAALPRTGQTVLADQVRRNVGGKGANQAVAARRFGAEVHLVARTGDDAAAGWLRCGLSSAGVRVDGVREVPGTRSGTAYITVAGGENTIVVDAGANHAWPAGAGASLPDAVRWAVAATSASVRFPGTHGSYADRDTVARLLGTW